MVQFTINIPQERVADLLDAFAVQYNYQAEIDDPNNPDVMIPNPVSKAQFAKNTIKTYIKEVYIAGKLKEIENTRQQIIAQSNQEISTIDVT
jgi:hypothetical protein